jgi:hypothetical protein
MSLMAIACSARAAARSGASATFAAVLLSAGPSTGASTAFRQHPALPSAFDTFLAGSARLSASERTALLRGDSVIRLLESDPGKEVAVFGAVWINASPSAYVEQVKDIEQLERGGAFRVTKRISNPPRAEDFDALEIPDQDLEDLRECRVGDCELKLSANAVQTLRAQVDWSRPSARADANRVFRRLALEYVEGYREGGNARLAVYRDKNRPTFVANEFRSMIDRLPPLAAHLPDLKGYLLDYPHATLADSSDFLYWQETQFGLKPTIRISHLIVQERPERIVVASKMLYASHYFWTALELRILVPDPRRGPGFWFITINRSRSDGLSGFIGRFVRGRVRNEVRSGTLAALTTTKATLEAVPK